MQANWNAIFEWCLIHEGGWSNHKDDPGGATMKGITQRVYDAFRRRNGVQTQTVRNITDEEVRTIYRAQYWDRVMGDDLPGGVDYAVYDFAVNSGVSRASKYLQAVVGVKQDGAIGQITLDAVAQMKPDDIVIALCNKRFAFLKRLRHWATFKNGWTRRVMGEQMGVQAGDIGVIDRGVRLARNAANIPAPVARPDNAGAKGEGPEKVTATAVATIKEIGASGPAALAAGGSLLTAVSEPPLAYFAGAALVLIVMAMAYVLVRKARAA